MKKEYVTSLDLSKRLAALGVKQESEFYWCIPEGGQDKDRFLSYIEDSSFCKQETCSFNHAYISAFLPVELGEMLPGGIETIRIDKYRGASYKKWICKDNASKYIQEADTEANARGLMLEYLIENKLMQV